MCDVVDDKDNYKCNLFSGIYSSSGNGNIFRLFFKLIIKCRFKIHRYP